MLYYSPSQYQESDYSYSREYPRVIKMWKTPTRKIDYIMCRARNFWIGIRWWNYTIHLQFRSELKVEVSFKLMQYNVTFILKCLSNYGLLAKVTSGVEKIVRNIIIFRHFSDNSLLFRWVIMFIIRTLWSLVQKRRPQFYI